MCACSMELLRGPFSLRHQTRCQCTISGRNAIPTVSLRSIFQSHGHIEGFDFFFFFFQLMDFYDPASATMRSPTSLFTLQRQEITPITSSGTPVIRTRRGASPFSARGMKSSRDHWRCCFTLAKWAGPVPGDDVR